MDKRTTKTASGRLLIGSLLALAIVLVAATARAGEPPGSAVALAQRIKARVQPELPSNLMVAEVSLPAALTPVAGYEIQIDMPQVSQEGQINVLVTLRSGGREARAWVRVLVESRRPASRPASGGNATVRR